MISQRDKELFENLFVLELANNHWGKVERGLKIIRDFGTIVRYNNIKAAIKLQFRDVENFIHKDFRNRQDIRYIKKTMDTRMNRKDLVTLVEAIRAGGCIPSATPFDEASVDLCEEMELPFLKLASSDVNDWFLIERMAKTKKPVLASSGGTSEKDLDDLVAYFDLEFFQNTGCR
jgi:N-acetylneuraminate synthase